MNNLPRMIQREIKPIRPYTTFETSTKEGIYRKMANYGCYSSGGSRTTHFSGYMPYGRDKADVIYVFSAEKVRAKWDHKTAKKPLAMVDGKPYRVMKSTQIRRAHWKVRVYRFDLRDVVSIEQKSRTFRTILK